MAVAPTITFAAYAVSGADPSGVRHLDLGDPSGFSFINNPSTDPGASLDFGSINITAGKQTTETFAVFARINEFNDLTEAVFNMRFWLPDLQDFGIGTFKFNGFASGTWIPNINLTEVSGKFVATTLPSGQNLFRNKDPNAIFNPNDVIFQELTASGIVDDQVTMYEFLSVTVDTNAGIKQYGGDGGGFTYRMTFDFR